jgi:hypothetical protein
VVDRIRVALAKMQIFHVAPWANHWSYDRMYPLLVEHFWWSNMTVDIKQFLAGCIDCARAKSVRPKPGPYEFDTVEGPDLKVHLDITGPYPTSDDGNVYCVMTVDAFSRWPMAIPVIFLPRTLPVFFCTTGSPSMAFRLELFVIAVHSLRLIYSNASIVFWVPNCRLLRPTHPEVTAVWSVSTAHYIFTSEC